MFQRALTAPEIAAVLERNPDIKGQVIQHNRLFEGTGQWDQVRMNESVYPNLPIPAKGRSFVDPVFGSVVVFPDTKGTLRWNAHVGIVPASISAPPFESPSGNTLAQMIEDLKNGFTGVAVVVVIAVAAFLIATRR